MVHTVKKLIVSFKHGWVSEVFILCKDTKTQQQMQERIAFSACAAVLFKKIFPLSTVPLQTLLLVQERRSGSLGPRWCC